MYISNRCVYIYIYIHIHIYIYIYTHLYNVYSWREAEIEVVQQQGRQHVELARRL